MSGLPIDLSTPAGVATALLPEIALTVWALILLLVIGWRHGRPDARVPGGPFVAPVSSPRGGGSSS